MMKKRKRKKDLETLLEKATGFREKTVLATTWR